jgi:hypothetical protein
VSLFVGHGFSHERKNKPHLKLHMKKVVLLISRVMPTMLGFGGRAIILTLVPKESIAVLGLCEVFSQACNISYFKFGILH